LPSPATQLGGEVAWRIAASAPQRVAALVLVDSAGYPIERRHHPAGLADRALPVLGRLAEHVLPRPIIVQGLVAVYGDPAKITEPLVDRTST
jgi:pimeloyl-ACP methyl ester carboxylesterase